MDLYINSEEMLQALFQGVFFIFETCIPFILPSIALMIVLGIIKIIIKKLNSFVHIEYSPREERKANKRIDNTVDIISNVIDLLNLKKNKK